MAGQCLRNDRCTASGWASILSPRDVGVCVRRNDNGDCVEYGVQRVCGVVTASAIVTETGISEAEATQRYQATCQKGLTPLGCPYSCAPPSVSCR